MIRQAESIGSGSVEQGQQVQMEPEERNVTIQPRDSLDKDSNEQLNKHDSDDDMSQEIESLFLCAEEISLNCFSKSSGIRKSAFKFFYSQTLRWLLLIFTIAEAASFLMTDYSFRSEHKSRMDLTINEAAHYIQLAANVCFSLEAIIGIIALGLYNGYYTYLRDVWNVSLLLVLIAGWISVWIVDNQIVNIIKFFRILTFFRLFPELIKKVNAFFRSFKHLGKTFFPLACFVVFYAVMGISFFQGHVESRCRLTEHPEYVIEDGEQKLVWEVDETNTLTCGYLKCPDNTFCGNPSDYDMPFNHHEADDETLLFGYNLFNNFYNAILSVYNFLMITGWIQTTYMYWRAQNKAVSAVYFVSLVLFLSQVLSNIILATLYEGFIGESYIKQTKKESKTTPTKLRLKLRRKTSIRDNGENDNNNKNDLDDNNIARKEFEKLNEDERQLEQKAIHMKKPSLRQQSESITSILKGQPGDPKRALRSEVSGQTQKDSLGEQSLTEMKSSVQLTFLNTKCRTKLRTLLASRMFQTIFNLNIIAQIILLCIDNHWVTADTYYNLNLLGFITMIIMFVETLFTLLAFPLSEFIIDYLNLMDLVILLAHIGSYIAEISQGSNLFSPSNQIFILIRCTEMLRVFKLLYKNEIFESIKVLLKTYYMTLRSIPEFLIVFCVLIILISQIGRELFAYTIPENSELMRINYDSVDDSMISVVMIFFNEEWHLTMYKYWSHTGVKSVAYHLICILICQVLYMRLFIAIFINQFMKWLRIHEKQFEMKLDQISTVTTILKRIYASIVQSNKNKVLPAIVGKIIKNNNHNHNHNNILKVPTNIPERLQETHNQQDPTKRTPLGNEGVQKLQIISNSQNVKVIEEDNNIEFSPIGNNNNNNLSPFFDAGTKQNFMSNNPSSNNILNPNNQLQVDNNNNNLMTPDTFFRRRSQVRSANKSNAKNNLIIEYPNDNNNHQQAGFLQINKIDPSKPASNTNINASDKSFVSGHSKSSSNYNLKRNKKGDIDLYNHTVAVKKNDVESLKHIQEIADTSNGLNISKNGQTHNLEINNMIDRDPTDRGFLPLQTTINNLGPPTLNVIPPILTSNEEIINHKDNGNSNPNRFKINSLNHIENQNHLNILYVPNDNNNKQINSNTSSPNTNRNNVSSNSKTNDSDSPGNVMRNQHQFQQQQKQSSISPQAENLLLNPSAVTPKTEHLAQWSSVDSHRQHQYTDDLALCLFSRDNSLRKFLIKVVSSTYFLVLRVSSIIIFTGIITWDSPFLDTESEEKHIIKITLYILTFFFLLENLLQCIAYGAIFNGKQSFLRSDYTHILNLATAILSAIYAADLSNKANFFSKFFLIFRCFLLLPFLSTYVSAIQQAGKLMWYCFPRMAKLMVFALLYLLMNSIVATKLLKDSSWKCSQLYSLEESKEVLSKHDCMDLGDDWVESEYNFNSVAQSLQILFMVQASEGWLSIMHDSFDSSSSDYQLQYKQHSMWVVFYIQFFFIANVCILNMFMGLIVESMLEMTESEDGIDKLTKQQKEWYFIKKSINHLVPTKKDFEPGHFIGNFLFRHMISGNALNLMFYAFSIINAISFMLFKNRIPKDELKGLHYINLICLIMMGLEIICRFTSLNRNYWRSRLNIFDILILIVGSINLYYQLNHDIHMFSDTYRILDGVAKGLQLLRLYRVFIHFLIFRKLFKSLHYALSSIFGVSLILIVFLYTSVLLSLNLFPYLKGQKTINDYDINFHSFFQALFSLIRIVTLEMWYLIPSEASQQQSPNFVCRDDMYDYSDFKKYGYVSCGSVASNLFFYTFFLIFTLVILNLFIATIIESYKEAFNADESAINHYQLDDILKLWTKYDPEGKGYISYKEFWQFSSQIAIIYGVDNEELMDIENKNKFLKQLDIPMYEDPVDKIFCYKFHDVVVRLSKVSVQIKYGVVDLETNDEKLREELDKKIEPDDVKGQQLIKPTPFTSSDMIVIIVLNRKVKQWKRKFIDKVEGEQDAYHFKGLTNKLKGLSKADLLGKIQAQIKLEEEGQQQEIKQH